MNVEKPQTAGVKIPNQATPSTAKSVGRGRGRGAVNLRRPGEPLRTVGATSNQSAAVNGLSTTRPPPGFTADTNSNVRRPPPGLGRGIAATSRSAPQQSPTVDMNNEDLFAGTTPAPSASTAPNPPTAWLST